MLWARERRKQRSKSSSKLKQARTILNRIRWCQDFSENLTRQRALSLCRLGKWGRGRCNWVNHQPKSSTIPKSTTKTKVTGLKELTFALILTELWVRIEIWLSRWDLWATTRLKKHCITLRRTIPRSAAENHRASSPDNPPNLIWETRIWTSHRCMEMAKPVEET